MAPFASLLTLPRRINEVVREASTLNNSNSHKLVQRASGSIATYCPRVAFEIESRTNRLSALICSIGPLHSVGSDSLLPGSGALENVFLTIFQRPSTEFGWVVYTNLDVLEHLRAIHSKIRSSSLVLVRTHSLSSTTS